MDFGIGGMCSKDSIESVSSFDTSSGGTVVNKTSTASDFPISVMSYVDDDDDRSTNQGQFTWQVMAAIQTTLVGT
tara:strand:+ start:2176 stop:2400 length:225 start_codon:yes stop_codon:yes gene_type:complete